LSSDGFKFWIWDTEPAFDYSWPHNWAKDHIGSKPFDTIYTALLSNTDFVMQTTDQMHCHCFNNGALTPGEVSQTYTNNYNATDIAMIAEAGRWASSSAYTGFVNAKNRIVNSYLPVRTNETINNYKNAGLYPNISAVNFNQYGGVLNSGTSVSLTNPNGTGTLYYTTDRTDPRASGGSVNSTAQTYNGSLSLSNGVYEVKARVKNGSTWSAMCPRKFYVKQNYSGLVINEIHYNPNDSIYYNNTINNMDTVSGRNFEFIELKNTSTQDIYLEDVYFNKGITIKFEYNVIIPPGGFAVIAEDAYWFQQKYGFAPDATYAGKLENSGENIWLLDPIDNIIDTLRYDDNLPWDTIPDNGQYSLALIDANLDNSNSTNWSAQVVYVTPKAENAFCDGSLSYNPMVVDLSCNASNDGFISGNATGGTAPYSYNWSNGATSSTLNNLSAGSYNLALGDVYGCVLNQNYMITEPPAMSATISSTNESSYQANNGTAAVNATGGTPPYTYSWSNGATSASISNLSPGTYSVDITDAAGCSLSETLMINALICGTLNVTVTTQHESCSGETDGLLQITNIQGGTSTYSILWSTGISGTVTNNLAGGIYQLQITDAKGCPFNESYTVNSATALSVNPVITNASSNNSNDGSIDLMVAGGTPAFTYYWSNAATTEDIGSLMPGNYWVSISDANNCQVLINNLQVESSCLTSIIQQNKLVVILN